jgi:uncharacterized protein (TIGR00251 family)
MMPGSDADPPAAVAIRVQPRASRDQVQGERNGAIAIQLRAAPVDGQANEALLRFVAQRLGVPRRRVELVRGSTGRSKWIRVEGLSAAEVQEQLLA